MSIDAAIRMGMGKENLTTLDLSGELGVHRSTASRWINGKTAPSQKTQREMAELFRVTFEEFIRWSELP